MKKTVLISVLILTIVTAIFALKSKNVTENSCVKIYGIVTEINEGGLKDATFKLGDNDTLFYINRALEKQFTLN